MLEYVYVTNRIKQDRLFGDDVSRTGPRLAGDGMGQFCDIASRLQSNNMLGRAVLRARGASALEESELVEQALDGGYENRVRRFGGALGGLCEQYSPRKRVPASGAGRHSRLFLERGHPVLAVDRDLSGLGDLAGQAGLETLEADLEDGRPFPFAGREFSGEVLAEGGQAPGVITAEIDPAEVAKARAMVPSLGHDRPFDDPSPLPALREAGE